MFRITRAVEGGTVAQWNMQQHQHLPTNSLFYDLAPHQADTASFFAADYIPQWLSHPSTGLRRQTPPFCYAILMLLPIIQNVRNLIMQHVDVNNQHVTGGVINMSQGCDLKPKPIELMQPIFSASSSSGARCCCR